MTSRQSGKIRVNGNSLYYEDSGRGTPIVFIHGANNTCDMWRPQVEALSRRSRVIVYDLRGHGRSGPTQLRFSIENLARDLEGLLDHLEATPAVVCGFSIGGCIAQEYAARYPSRVRALIISDSIGDSLAGAATGVARRLLRLTNPLITRSRLVTLAGIATSAMQRDVQKYFMRVAEKNVAKMSRDDRLAISTALLDFKRRDLSSFDKPTLVVAGAREPRRILNESLRLARRIPAATLRIIADAQHGPNRENVPAFNAAIEQLLTRVETGALRAA